MATLTVRDFDEGLKAKLRVRAADHGRSMEAEVRAILSSALTGPASGLGMGSRIRTFADVDEPREQELSGIVQEDAEQRVPLEEHPSASALTADQIELVEEIARRVYRESA